MKKLLFTATLFLGLVSLGMAQDTTAKQKINPEERAKKKTEMLTEKLSLTKDQQEKIYAINLEQAKQAEQFRQEAKEAREKMVDRRALMKKNEDKINSILNDKQKKEYEDMKKQRQEQFKHRRDGFRKDHKEKGDKI
ncbi:hypothetical protein [Rubrolithibacter danxiaensis]|uniref:hypothetical protein n=1 Tax=Rubrolithibacter danxiaensis TaxID=3390805 RepID=UPI003BF82709